MPLIEYTNPNIHIVRGSKGVEFEFRPGALNEVPDDVWEDLQKNSPGTQTLLARGFLRPVVVRMVKPAGKKEPGHVSDNVSVGDKMPPRRGKGKPKPITEEVGEPQQIDSIKDIDIVKMTAFDAIGLIEKIYAEETLEKFRADEDKHRRGPRKKVIEALDKQLAMMRTDPTQGAEK